ncbi:MAG: hypothetical protein RLZZ117_2313 [Cyanobacteriota bacterium]
MAELQGPWLDLWVGFRRCPLASRVVSPSGRGILRVWLGCDRWGRVGIGRKAERIHGGEPLPASGVLLPQLLGFFLDLLGLVPHLQDFSLELPRSLIDLPHPPLVLHLALLVAWIATPVQHR